MKKTILIIMLVMMASMAFATPDEYYIENLTAGYYLNDSAYDGVGDIKDILLTNNGTGFGKTFYDGTVTGATLNSSCGLTNMSDCYSFVDNQYIEATGLPQMVSDVTMMGWVYTDGNFYDFVNLFGSTTPDAFFCRATAGSDDLYCRTKTAGSVTSNINNIALNTWQHIAFTYDGTNQKAYLNGVLVDTDSQTGNIVLQTGTVHFGRNGGDYMNGSMDEIKIYYKALDITEIQAEMSASALADSEDIVAYYDFNGDADDRNFKSVGHEASTDYLSKGMNFDGNNQYINAGTLGIDEGTICTWWKIPEDLSSMANTDMTLVDKDGQFTIRINADSSDKIQVILWDAVGTPNKETVTNTWLGNTWYHTCITTDGSNMQIYTNGETDNSALAYNSPLDSTANTFKIGNNNGFNKDLNGTLQEVRIYDKALTSDEVLTLYHGLQNASFLSYETITENSIQSFNVTSPWETVSTTNGVAYMNVPFGNYSYNFSKSGWYANQYYFNSTGGVNIFMMDGNYDTIFNFTANNVYDNSAIDYFGVNLTETLSGLSKYYTTSCYQEFANETPCGQSEIGNYTIHNLWTNAENVIDGDYGTYGLGNTQSPRPQIDISYVKPASFGEVIWQVKSINGFSTKTQNATVPLICVNAFPERIDFQLTSFSTSDEARFSCYNGTDYIVVVSEIGTTQPRIYEEGIYWESANQEVGENVDGTISIGLVNNASYTYDAEFTSPLFYNQTNPNVNIGAGTYQFDTYQSILVLFGLEKYTNATVPGASFNSSLQSGTTLYVNAGTIPVTVTKAGYYSETQDFIIPLLTNITEYFEDMYTASVNITGYNYTGVQIGTFGTTYTKNLTTEPASSSGSEVHYEMIAGNYNITFTASGYPVYEKEFTIVAGQNNINFTFGAFNVTANDSITGATVTSFNGTAVGNDPTVTGSTTTGNLILTVVPGSYNITVSATNYSTFGNTVEATTGENLTAVNVELYDSNVVLITLYDSETGLPLTTLNATSTFVDGVTYQFPIVNGTGWATDLAEATYEVTTIATGYSPATYLITVTEDSYQALDVYMIATGSSSNVAFTIKDFNTGNVIADATLTVETPVNGTWTLVNSFLSDVTGRVALTYIENNAYRFTTTKLEYQQKLFTLNPISFASYTVRLTPNSTNPNQQDYSNIVIIINPNNYRNNHDENFTILFASPEGEFTDYFYNITTSWNATAYAGSGTNANGGTLTDTILITNVSLLEKVYLQYGYTKSDGSSKNYSKLYVIGDGTPNSTTMWGQKGKHYGLGLLERILIVVTVVLLLAGIAFAVSGINGSGLVAILVISYFIKLEFVPVWALIASLISIFMLVTWRSTF